MMIKENVIWSANYVRDPTNFKFSNHSPFTRHLYYYDTRYCYIYVFQIKLAGVNTPFYSECEFIVFIDVRQKLSLIASLAALALFMVLLATQLHKKYTNPDSINKENIQREEKFKSKHYMIS